MTEIPKHDPLCRQSYWTGDDCYDCYLIAKVRADERDRTFAHVRSGSPWSWLCLVDRDDECEWCACTCHAERVAARLVEVICEMQGELDNYDGAPDWYAR